MLIILTFCGEKVLTKEKYTEQPYGERNNYYLATITVSMSSNKHSESKQVNTATQSVSGVEQMSNLEAMAPMT